MSLAARVKSLSAISVVSKNRTFERAGSGHFIFSQTRHPKGPRPIGRLPYLHYDERKEARFKSVGALEGLPASIEVQEFRANGKAPFSAHSSPGLCRDLFADGMLCARRAALDRWGASVVERDAGVEPRDDPGTVGCRERGS
jgi:hypothetical protein